MTYTFYAGGYTSGPGDAGIHRLRFDSVTGELRLADAFFGGESPSFLIRKGNFLYAANEIRGAGKVSALSIQPDGALSYLGGREVSGAGTCHVAEMNGFLYGANYSSGSIFGVELLPDGSLGKTVTEIQHEGSGPHPARQTKTYAHSVNPIPGSNLLIAADLGADKLFLYRQQPGGSLTPDGRQAFAAAPPGGGPRHLALHPNGRFLYAVMEMGVSLVCYAMTDETPALEYVAPLVDVPFTDADTAADVHFTADGKRLYASVRGLNLISAFDIGEDGGAAFLGSYPAGGDSPRNFCLSPEVGFILIANQASGEVCARRLDQTTGAAGEKVGSVSIPRVSCVIPGPAM